MELGTLLVTDKILTCDNKKFYCCCVWKTRFAMGNCCL